MFMRSVSEINAVALSIDLPHFPSDRGGSVVRWKGRERKIFYEYSKR
jgi:hypothetical protein